MNAQRPVDELERLMTRAEVKTYLGVSDWWIKARSKGTDPMPWVGTPRKQLMRPSDLNDWLNRNSLTT